MAFLVKRRARSGGFSVGESDFGALAVVRGGIQVVVTVLLVG